MNYELNTALLCVMGWLCHWLSSWGEAYKLRKSSLFDFIDDSPPTFWFSVISTAAVYLIGPSVLPAIGISLPDTLSSDGLKLVVAFMVGYMADSVVYKIANLMKKS